MIVLGLGKEFIIIALAETDLPNKFFKTPKKSKNKPLDTLKSVLL